MEKKMYYVLDNNDVNQILDIDGLKEVLQGEAGDYTEAKNKEDEPEWKITLVWMTDEEYGNLPDAY